MGTGVGVGEGVGVAASVGAGVGVASAVSLGVQPNVPNSSSAAAVTDKIRLCMVMEKPPLLSFNEIIDGFARKCKTWGRFSV